MLTPKQVRALQVIRDHGKPIRAHLFGQKLWPDARGWSRHYNCGPNASTTGSAMWWSAGGYLGRLQRRGLVRQDWTELADGPYLRGYVLTDAGQKALQEAETAARQEVPS